VGGAFALESFQLQYCGATSIWDNFNNAGQLQYGATSIWDNFNNAGQLQYGATSIIWDDFNMGQLQYCGGNFNMGQLQYCGGNFNMGQLQYGATSIMWGECTRPSSRGTVMANLKYKSACHVQGLPPHFQHMAIRLSIFSMNSMISLKRMCQVFTHR
jgi:hypothetical protein